MPVLSANPANSIGHEADQLVKHLGERALAEVDWLQFIEDPELIYFVDDQTIPWLLPFLLPLVSEPSGMIRHAIEGACTAWYALYQEGSGSKRALLPWRNRGYSSVQVFLVEITLALLNDD